MARYGSGGWTSNNGRRVFAQQDRPPWAPSQTALHNEDAPDELGSRAPGQNDGPPIGLMPDQLLDGGTSWALSRGGSWRASREPEDRHHAHVMDGRDVSAVTPVGTLPAASTALHDTDLGAVEDRTRMWGPTRAGQQPESLALTMPFAGATVSPLASVRGRNSLPENNPDGIARLGTRQFRWFERKMFSGWLRHDEHVITIRTAARATSSPGGTNRNMPPSGSTQVLKPNIGLKGILRRTPPLLWDEPVLTEEAAPVAPQYQSWGF